MDTLKIKETIYICAKSLYMIDFKRTLTIPFIILFLNANATLFAQNFKEEEITFQNGENTFSGTLTIPNTAGKHPAVVLITGSGAQTRDCDVLGFKVFQKIAEFLTSQGLAVLRYDDRNTGKSKGKTLSASTTAELAYDVVAAVQYLRTRPDINPKQIGLYGHSEGGTVAPIAALQDDEIAFVILAAGTGVTGGKLILAQTEALLRADTTYSEAFIKATLEQSKAMIENIEIDGDWEKFRQESIPRMLKTAELLPENIKKYVTNPTQYAQATIDAQIKNAQTIWFSFFVLYDPVEALEKLTCPALLLFGELDLQVIPQQNMPPMKAALEKAKNKDFTIITFPSANHLFQKAKTGRVDEYASLPKEFVEGYEKTIAEWLLKRVKIVKVKK